MAYQGNPNDLLINNPADDNARRQARINPSRLDNELQPDPELAEGPASGGRIAVFAVAIALVLGALFYGLNTSTLNQAGTTPTSQTAQTSPPPAPPGMRDVTPRANTEPGVTTGAATSAPTGADVNRSGNPPMGNNATGNTSMDSNSQTK